MSQNYKDTLSLPKTDFPMKASLVQREPERLARWESQGLYAAIQKARKGAPLFVLHDGPPFANGDVHMGTALNKILKDLIVKSKTMAGFRAPFVPGWDCHGLPIEFKVVKESRGLTPVEVREKSAAYARKFIDIQRAQFRRLGVFGDWEKPYLTLDPGYEAEILRAFARFVEKGMVYQSKKPVYWSTGAQTALAEAEVEYADRVDPAIFVRFGILTGDLAGKASFVIWTTTPWTLPANVAIAVQANSEYVAQEFEMPDGRRLTLTLAEALVGKFCLSTGARAIPDSPRTVIRGSELEGVRTQHPFLDRESPIILGDFVTMETGTGGVHIAPGHGADDYIAGLKYGLPLLSPVDDHGRFTEEVGVPIWAGKYVFDANREVVAHLQERGALLGQEEYTHSYPHCWRSKTPVVFRAVEQFFIRIDDLRAGALEGIDNTEWIPHWGRNRIRGTVESRPDWCISRQRTWGVPLPAFYNADKKAILDANLIRNVADLVAAEGTDLWFAKDDAWWAERLGLPQGTSRRNDTIDVWIDSGVSHEAVLRHHPDLAWPADIYLEATDQHRGWFQSSLMTSIALNGAPPYRTVITHGFVVDRDGKKISKSSSYKKPMDAAHFVGQYGADIVRLWVASIDYQNEVPFSEEAFTRLGEAYRQFRNVLRILLANLHDFDPAKDASLAGATAVDRWLLSRLQSVIATCRQGYAEYDFRKVFQTLNQFFTVDLSALYVDVTKDRLYCDAPDSPRRRATQTVMRMAADALSRLLAPILAFTADEAWEFAGHTTSVHLETFPEPDDSLRDLATEQEIASWLELRAVVAKEIERARQEKIVGKAVEGQVSLALSDHALLSRLRGREEELAEFFTLSELSLIEGPSPAASLVASPHGRCERCWRHLPTVGQSVSHPSLCSRCEPVVEASRESNPLPA